MRTVKAVLWVSNESNVNTFVSDPVWNFEEVGDSMLYHVNTYLNYNNAKKWCQGLGAQLVEFWTEKEYQDVSCYL